MSDETAAPAPASPETAYETPKWDCRIAYRPAGHILQMLMRPFANDISERLPELTDGSAYALRAAGPGVWYIVGDATLTPHEIEQREIRLGRLVTLIDQTHGRVRLELVGPGAGRHLATGTAVDMSPTRFCLGSACETLFGHIGVHITRTGPDHFEVLVGRSFAWSLWEQMTC